MKATECLCGSCKVGFGNLPASQIDFTDPNWPCCKLLWKHRLYYVTEAWDQLTQRLSSSASMAMCVIGACSVVHWKRRRLVDKVAQCGDTSRVELSLRFVTQGTGRTSFYILLRSSCSSVSGKFASGVVIRSHLSGIIQWAGHVARIE
jgi:hypothetical protein